MATKNEYRYAYRGYTFNPQYRTRESYAEEEIKYAENLLNV